MIPWTLTPPQRWRPFDGAPVAVRLSNDARACVVFLGICRIDGDASTFVPRSTGFLMRARGIEPIFLVTNKHCIINDDCEWVRLNTRDGSIVLELEKSQWIKHPDPTVDIALLEFVLPPNAACKPYQLELHPPNIKYNFGPGDLIYTVGLFVNHAGKSRNVPIVHAGSIASFSEDEMVLVQDWESDGTKAIDAYIAQCTTVDGSSGSPVFVRSRAEITGPDHEHNHRGEVVRNPRASFSRELPQAYGAVELLGVWQGSWEIPAPNMDTGVRHREPRGYGVIVPIEKVFEMLDLPEVQARDEKAKKELAIAQAHMLSVPDGDVKPK